MRLGEQLKITNTTAHIKVCMHRPPAVESKNEWQIKLNEITSTVKYINPKPQMVLPICYGSE